MAVAGEVEARVTRASALAEVGELGAAEAEYRAALTLDPASLAARAGLATVLLGTRRPHEAEAEFRRTWAAGATVGLSGLAMSLRARGALDDARTLLEAALACGIDDPLARDLLAEFPPRAPALGEEIELAGLGFSYADETLALRCRRCGRAWERQVGSPMCDVTLHCPGCGTPAHVPPEALDEAAGRVRPPLPAAAADALDRAAGEIVATWHQDPALAPALHLGDVNVGAAAEQELMAVVLDAVLAAMSGDA